MIFSIFLNLILSCNAEFTLVEKRVPKKPLSMIIEILTDFDWDEVSKTDPSFDGSRNEYCSQVQTDLAGPSEIIYLSVFRTGEFVTFESSV